MIKKICGLFLIVACFCACAPKEEAPKGYVTFYALDGLSGLPIENVKIVLPENDCVLETGSDGRSERAEIEVIEDKRYPIAQNYGTFSVLGYKEGYNDYALFFAQIKEGQNREIKLYMFKTDTPLSNGAPLATVESPEKEWVKELVEKFRK